MYHSVLRPGAQRQLKKIGQADLVIGLPSYKNPASAAYVTRVALAGARRHYPHLRTVLVNADAGHRAATRRAVVAQTSDNGQAKMVVSGRYEGLLGRGNATAALLDAALALDAQAIVILDSYTGAAQPAWIAGLAHLILEDKADLVIPRYRHWPTPEGIFSDLLAYPFFRALWGQSVRYPLASDFALTPKLAAAFLDEDIWGTAAATFGLPPWLATYCAVGRWRIAQTALSQKFPHKVEGDRPALHQATAPFEAFFEDNVTVLFRLLSRYSEEWQGVTVCRSLPTLTRFAQNTEALPHPLEADLGQLLDKLALGWIEYRLLWRYLLTADNLAQVEALAALPPERFYFPSDLWARIIYDFAVGFNKGETDPLQIVQALLPLYHGRLAAFSQEIAGLAPVGREGTVAAQAVEFEEARAYLKKRWKSYRPPSHLDAFP